jgi:N4-gp56 family major capsid protein
MAQTTQSALSAAITFKVQKQVLKNLRAALVWADRSWAEQGDFTPGFDTLTFVSAADIALNVTPLVEGSKPTAKALTIATVTVSTDQYGDLVSITDIAKVKSPIEIVQIGSERLARQAQESLDQISRDIVAVGGTSAFLGVGVPTTRAGIAATDLMRSTDLRKLRAKMIKAKIPVPDDGYFRLAVHPNVAYDLRMDTALGGWTDVNKYATPETLLRGEVGRMDGFRITEVVNAPTFASTVTVYRSIATGAIKSWGAGDLQTLSTYHVAPGGDHTDPLAQEELLGWKVNFGVAVLSNGYYFGAETAATNV